MHQKRNDHGVSEAECRPLPSRWFGAGLRYGWILACALSACTPVYCITPHGMILATEPTSSGVCGRLSTVESKMVDSLGHAERLTNFVIETRPEGSFTDPYKRKVGGYTDCWARTMVVGGAPTVFAHETAHALQNCQARQPDEDGIDYDHANWHTDGIYTAIEKASE